MAMADDIENLILSPFRELSEKGSLTVKNAQDVTEQDSEKASQIKKSGQALAREGDRAVKRLEPLCTRHLEESGACFVEAVKGQGEITRHRCLLNEKLWDFEDYTEVDTFDSAKFTELQRLSRDAAPKIVDILMTMRLDMPLPLYPFPTHSLGQDGMGPNDSSGHQPQQERFAFIEEATLYGNHLFDRPLSVDSDEPPPQIPRKSSSRNLDTLAASNRTSTPPTENDDALLSVPQEAPIAPNPKRLSPRTALLLSQPSHTLEYPRPDSFSSFSPANPPIPEEEAVNGTGVDQNSMPSSARASHSSSLRSQSSQRMSTGSIQSSLFDSKSNDNSSDKRHTMLTVPDTNFPILALSSAASPAGSCAESMSLTSNSTAPSRSHSHASTVMSTQSEPEVAMPVIEDGLISVEHETDLSELNRRQPDCSIGPESSFYQFRGFCEGAKEAQQGGFGVKKAKRRGIWNVARCKTCTFELDWDTISTDLHDRLPTDPGHKRISGLSSSIRPTSSRPSSSQGPPPPLSSPQGHVQKTFTLSSIRYRISFLLKSHIHTKNPEEPLYGCPFCITQGHTTEESDATVFFNREQLFAHLSRHPRPLPSVAGILVAEGADDTVSAELALTRDLHFKEPPAPLCVPAARAEAREIWRLPTGVASETLSGNGLGVPLDWNGLAGLKFAVGARVVGIQFPSQYEGEWCTGWSDGVKGCFPAEMVKVETPGSGEVKLQLSSSLVACARWKWPSSGPKEKGGKGKWLRLEKGETVTNICWAYAEHWCWSGTNSKGNWGLFPQSHLEPKSLRDLNGSSADLLTCFMARDRNNHESNTTLPSTSSVPPSPSASRPPSRSGSMMSSAMKWLPMMRDSSGSGQEKGPRLVIY